MNIRCHLCREAIAGDALREVSRSPFENGNFAWVVLPYPRVEISNAPP